MPRIQPLYPLLRPMATPRRAACQHLLRFSTTTRLRVDQPVSTSKKSTPAATTAATPSKTLNPSPEAPPASRAADLAATEAATEADSAQAPAPKPVLPSKRAPSDEKTKKPLPAKDAASPAKPKKSASAKDAAPQAKANKAAGSESSKGAASPTKPQKPAASPSPQAVGSPAKPAKPTAPKSPPKPQIELPPPKYHIQRTSNNNLPIYTDYKRGGNLHLTTVRKITGDLTALRDELRVFLNKEAEDVKINGLPRHVVIKGFHKAQVCDFLVARGM